MILYCRTWPPLTCLLKSRVVVLPKAMIPQLQFFILLSIFSFPDAFICRNGWSKKSDIGHGMAGGHEFGSFFRHFVARKTDRTGKLFDCLVLFRCGGSKFGHPIANIVKTLQPNARHCLMITRAIKAIKTLNGILILDGPTDESTQVTEKMNPIKSEERDFADNQLSTMNEHMRLCTNMF